MRTILITLTVVVGAVALSTVGIKAVDLYNEEGICPDDMVPVQAVPGVLCVDRFEAVPDSSCPQAVTDSPQATKGNLAVPTCQASGALMKAVPWRYVTREEARQLCARSGKRLPTADEWYNLALSSDVGSCNFSETSPTPHQATDLCLTSDQAVNLPGNVWEWVSDDVVSGSVGDFTLASSGYVAMVNASGIPTMSSSTPVIEFASDYIKSDATGTFGIVRGGFYGSGEDGGLYAVQANILPTFVSPGIGFRCVR